MANKSLIRLSSRGPYCDCTENACPFDDPPDMPGNAEKNVIFLVTYHDSNLSMVRMSLEAFQHFFPGQRTAPDTTQVVAIPPNFGPVLPLLWAMLTQYDSAITEDDYNLLLDFVEYIRKSLLIYPVDEEGNPH